MSDIEFLKRFGPYLVLCIFLGGALGAFAPKYINTGVVQAKQEVVVFDVIKFTNAQRLVASKIIGNADESSEGATLLLSVSKRTEGVIEKYSEGSVVILKQAVLAGQYRDITDDVLKELGLPVDGPSMDPGKLAIDMAPTNFILQSRGKVDSAETARSVITGDIPKGLIP